jgi:hypothetical protein
MARLEMEPQNRLNGVCPYYTMFPLDFPLRVLRNAQPGDAVLDPFCGRGTTNYAARLLGLQSVGIDSNPVAVAIARAKASSTDASQVVALCKRLLKGSRTARLPDGAFWDWAFHPKTLAEITILRESLKRLNSPAANALRGLMLGVLHGPRRKGLPAYLSNQMPRTYATKPSAAVRFWRKRRMRPFYVDTLDVIKRRAPLLFDTAPPASKTDIILGDSRAAGVVSGGPFRWIITSPAYIGMNSYARDQWLRYWFLGGTPDVPSTKEIPSFPYIIDEFVNDLAKVWRKIALVCTPAAHLIVRFGSLPSHRLSEEPFEIMRRSLRDTPWRIVTLQDAGNCSIGYRQANSFQRSPKRAAREVDVYARLR